MSAEESGKRLGNTKIFVIIAVGVLYYICGKISLDFAFLNESASPIWLPTAISIAAFIKLGYKVSPAVFLAAFFVNLTTSGTAATSFAIAAGNTLEGATALYLVDRFLDKDHLFDKPFNIFSYALFVGALSTFVSAVIGTLSLSAGGFIEPANRLMVFWTWWIGDIGSAIFIAPLLLLWLNKSEISWNIQKSIEAFTILLLIIVSSFIIFLPELILVELPLIIERYPYPLMIFPLILLTAFKFGVRETALVIFVFYIIAVIGIINGSERMASEDPNMSFINLQIFTAIMFLLMMSVCAAISQRKKMEGVLSHSEERYRTLAETASDAIISIDQENRIIFCNKSVEEIFGYSPDELLGNNLEIIMPVQSRKAHMEGIKNYIRTGKRTISWARHEVTGLHKNGKEIFLDIAFGAIRKEGEIYFSGMIRDITGRKLAQQQLEDSLKEKEVLLREIHHRVKNNLQIISSLLNLQASSATDIKDMKVIKESISRVHAMGLLHEKLYQSKNLSSIDFTKYINDLASFLVSSYSSGDKKLDVIINQNEVTIDFNIGIPLGLIISELISNSIKHAFNGRHNGEIHINLGRTEDGWFQILIKDNGVGLPENFVMENSNTLGLQIVYTLVDQLRGKLNYKNENGAEFRIEFPEPRNYEKG
jgi:PAS domain S-box-containing protein